ncbi:MAG TPA: hypothetical protein VF613_10110 [Longimicrobium sp.]|jgi:hypothetical protein
MKLLLTGSVVSRDGRYNQILGEMNEVNRVRGVTPGQRMRLLQVLHATRALDSTLAAFIAQRPVPVGAKVPHSLGQYIHLLENHTDVTIGRLPAGSKGRYQTTIANPRNRFMHEAGAYPAHDRDIRSLLGEMQACITAVLAI